MPRALFLNAREPLTFTLPSDKRYFLMANSGSLLEIIENQGKLLWRTPGVSRNLAVRVTTNTFTLRTMSYGTRVDSSDGAQRLDISPGATGFFEEDFGIFDTFLPDQLISYWIHCPADAGEPGGNTFQYSCVSSTFTPFDPAETTVWHGAVTFSDMSDGTTYYCCLADRVNAAKTSEAEMRFDTNAPTNENKLRNFTTFIGTNTGGLGNTFLAVNVDGIGSLTLTIPVNTTGRFQDTASTNLAVDVDVNYSIDSNASVTTFVPQYLACEEVGTTSRYHSIYGATRGWGTILYNATQYSAIGGGGQRFETEVSAQMQAQTFLTASNLTCYVVTNTVA